MLSSSVCFVEDGRVEAGEVDLDIKINPEKQTKICQEIEMKNYIELCKMNETFVLNRFIFLVSLMDPEKINPLDCAVPSWEFTEKKRRKRRFKKYLTWREVELQGIRNPFDVNFPLDVTTKTGVSLEGDPRETGPGEGLICVDGNDEYGKNLNRWHYVVGVSFNRSWNNYWKNAINIKRE